MISTTKRGREASGGGELGPCAERDGREEAATHGVETLGRPLDAPACAGLRRRTEGSHPDSARLDDGEMAGPIFSRGDEIGKPPPDVARPRKQYTKQDDATRLRQFRSLGELAKALIEGQDNASLARRLVACGYLSMRFKVYFEYYAIITTTPPRVVIFSQ